LCHYLLLPKEQQTRWFGTPTQNVQPYLVPG
jgi:hypothetical protein